MAILSRTLCSTRRRISARGPSRPDGHPRREAWLLSALVLGLGLLQLGALPGINLGQSEGELPEAFPSPAPAAYLSHQTLPPGASGTLLITLEVAPDFHIQLNDFLEVRLPEEAPLTLGPYTITRLESWEGEQVIRGPSALKVPFTVAADAPAGLLDLIVFVGYQGCAEQPIFACFPPDEAQLALRLEISGAGDPPLPAHEELFAAHGGVLGDGQATGDGGATGPGAGAGDAAQAAAGGSLAQRLEGALASGSLLAFLLVFLGGILTSFTPCVYPMIPITISYVGGRARNRMHGFILSLFFVLGIAIMYSTLGLLAASTGTIFGAAMQSTVVMVIVAAIFTAMGASMLGAFDLTLPAGMQGRMTTGAQRGGVIGAILMGMVTGLVASPCVGPVLVVLLTFVAKAGSLFLGFWLLFAFACGLGLLFLVLGTFAGALSALPGAGSWMDTIKHLFGVILIAMAIYYLRALLGAQGTRLAFGIYLVIVGVFGGAFTPLPEAPERRALLRKSLGILLFMAGAVLFLLWLAVVTGAPQALGLHAAAVLPGLGAPGAARAAGHPEPPWRVNDEGALEEAHRLGQPAIQDFWADWCAACKELDEKTWSDPRVLEEAKRFIPLKMDLTRRGESSSAATRRFQVRGMPTVILYDREGNEATRFVGFKGPDQVLEIMRSVH